MVVKEIEHVLCCSSLDVSDFVEKDGIPIVIDDVSKMLQTLLAVCLRQQEHSFVYGEFLRKHLL
jgi:hypothetical protein